MRAPAVLAPAFWGRRTPPLRGILWYTGCKQQRVAVVLLRDPSGKWRDEALLCTDVTKSVEEVVAGYCRRWSIEVAFHDAKQYLGMADARVWCEASMWSERTRWGSSA